MPRLLDPEVGFSQGLADLGADGGPRIQMTMLLPHYKKEAEEYTVTRKVPETIQDPVTKKLTTRYVEVPEMRTRTVMKAHWQGFKKVWPVQVATPAFFELDGSAVDPGTLGERLKKPALVVVTQDGPQLPGYFAFLFRPGTLVFHLTPDSVMLTAQPGAIRAGEPAGLPDSLPPTFRLAKAVDQSHVALRVILATDRQVTGLVTSTEKVADGGEVKEVTQQRPVTMLQEFRTSFTTIVDQKAVTGTTAEGQPLVEAHWNALGQRELPVVVSRDGKAVDPFWLQSIKPKMLVLVPPAAEELALPIGVLGPPAPAIQPLPSIAPDASP